MKPSDFQKTIQCQFDCKLKRVVKGIVRNYRKELKRRRNKEISYCELPEIVVEKLAVWDEYESDYTAFDVCGIEVRVLDDDLAEAIKYLSALFSCQRAVAKACCFHVKAGAEQERGGLNKSCSAVTACYSSVSKGISKSKIILISASLIRPFNSMSTTMQTLPYLS